MKFLSIQEYFYKLNTIGFILLLLPMVAFIFLYYGLIYYIPPLPSSQSIFLVMEIAIAISFIALTTVYWACRVRMGRLSKLIELARKMDGYYSITLLRMGTYGGCSLLMAAGFFATGESWFTALFIVIALGMVLQWPSRPKFCRQFGLRGGERDMIMNNRNFFQKNRRG